MLSELNAKRLVTLGDVVDDRAEKGHRLLLCEVGSGGELVAVGELLDVRYKSRVLNAGILELRELERQFRREVLGGFGSRGRLLVQVDKSLSLLIGAGRHLLDREVFLGEAFRDFWRCCPDDVELIV